MNLHGMNFSISIKFQNIATQPEYKNTISGMYFRGLEFKEFRLKALDNVKL